MYTKNELNALIARANVSLKGMEINDPSYDILKKYIMEAENILSEVEGDLTSSQNEVYNQLEAAIGP